jgi:hypothetical protein
MAIFTALVDERPFLAISAQWRGLPRTIVFRRRTRGVLAVTRQQMLQPGQLARQDLILLPQLQQLSSHRHDVRIPHRDELILLHHEPD